MVREEHSDTERVCSYGDTSVINSAGPSHHGPEMHGTMSSCALPCRNIHGDSGSNRTGYHNLETFRFEKIEIETFLTRASKTGALMREAVVVSIISLRSYYIHDDAVIV